MGDLVKRPMRGYRLAIPTQVIREQARGFIKSENYLNNKKRNIPLSDG